MGENDSGYGGIEDFIRRLVAPEDEDASGPATVGQKLMRPTPEDQVKQAVDTYQKFNGGGKGVPLSSSGSPAGASRFVGENNVPGSTASGSEAAPVTDMTQRRPSLIRPLIRNTSSSQEPASAPAPDLNAVQPSSAAFRGIPQSSSAAAPAPPNDPNIPSLVERRAQLAQPLNVKDPKYKMGLGQRLLGVLANFSSGVGGRGPVSYIGPGATNRQYDIDEAAREKQIGATDTEIKQRQDLAEENRKQYQTAAQAEERGAISQRNVAQADKYKNAVDPQSIRYDDGQQKWLGKTYGGEEREVEEPKWHAQEGRKTTEDENTIAPNARPEYDQKSKSFTIATKSGKRVPWQPKSVEEGVSAEIAAGIKNGPYQQRKDRELNLSHPNEGRGGKATSDYDGLSANERRLVEANAPGMYDRIKDMERQRSEWVSISGEDSAQVKNIDASLAKARPVLADAVQKVLDARAPRKTKQPAPPGSSAARQQPNQQGGQKSITKAQIQDLANKNGIAYDAAEKQFKDKGYQVK